MTVRELRKARQENRLRIARVLPEPPEEWIPYRRDRMKVAISCACLYLWHGMRWNQIADKLQLGRLTKQRVAQYVKKGAAFLEERGALKVVE